MDILNKKAYLFMVSLVVIFAGCQGQQAPTPTTVANVEVVPVTEEDVPVYSEWVTTLDGYVNANIQPQVSGYLIRQAYKEGSFVHQGDVLFEIDPRPFKVALEKSQGTLAQAQAQLGKATEDVNRDKPLAEEKAIAQSQLDDDIQAQLAAQAAKASAQADVDQAKLNLDFTEVKSLIDGIAGIAKGQMGDLVGPTTLLTTVSQVDPIKAYVSMSESEYSIYTKVSLSDLAPELILQDEKTYSLKGTFIFADRQIDTGTGTILVAVSFPNPGNILRPGQFGRVRAVMSVKKNALLITQRAVTELQGGDQVAVVGDDNKVTIKTVKVGSTVGALWVIEDGLEANDRVVVEGIQNIKDGAVVNPIVVNLSNVGK